MFGGTPPSIRRFPDNEARDGVTGHNVRYVLGFGLAGVVIAFAIAYAVMVGWP